MRTLLKSHSRIRPRQMNLDIEARGSVEKSKRAPGRADFTGARLLTREEAADYLRVSKWTLWYWRSKGHGPVCVKMNACVRYRWADLQAYLRNHLVRPSTSKQRDL